MDYLPTCTLQLNIKHRSQSVFPSLSFLSASYATPTQAGASGVWARGFSICGCVCWLSGLRKQTNAATDPDSNHMLDEKPLPAPPVRDVRVFRLPFCLSSCVFSTSSPPVGAVVMLYCPEKLVCPRTAWTNPPKIIYVTILFPDVRIMSRTRD